MNYSMIIYVIGWIFNFEACFLVLPCIVAAIYRESDAFVSLVAALVLSLVLGLLLTRRKPKRKTMYAREGFVIVALSWILLSMVGALPFVWSGYIPSYIDALFETVSGFTTTGASILQDVEALPRGLLFWRSFTHWIGGMGVLVFIMALVPLSGGNNMHMMKAESPGPSVGKLVPHVKKTAFLLYAMYFFLTVLEFIFLLAGRMPLYDAIVTSFGTAGTGGFGIRNDSIAGYSAYIQVVITIFMIAFGVNFNVYYLIFTKRIKEAFQSSELRWYLLIIAGSVLIITYNISQMFDSVWVALRHAGFQVGSIITTTGFATTDFNLWPEVSRTILVILMFIGACAGSTGGGMKVSRLIILMKTVFKELEVIIHPRGIKKIKMDQRPIEHEVVRSTNVYMVAYVVLFVMSILLIAIDNFDLVTNFTAVAATINNIGPGLGLVGPTGNFSAFSDFSKLILTFDMLVGRLELFPMLILFSPSTWKK